VVTSEKEQEMTTRPRRGWLEAWAAGAAILALCGLSCSFLLDNLDCRTNQDCFQKAEDTVCRHDANSAIGTCVRLKSPECERLYGERRDDDALVIGSVLPTTGDDQSGLSIQNAIELAMDDMPGGIPLALGSDRRRPLALVGCSDENDPAKALAALRHLAELQVPAIIGSKSSEVTQALATGTGTATNGSAVADEGRGTVGRRILLISPAATAKSITSSDDDNLNLVWRTAPSDVFQGSVLAKYVEKVAEQVGKAPSPATVVIVYELTEYGKALRDSLDTNLRGSASEKVRLLDGVSFGEGQPTDAVRPLVDLMKPDSKPDSKPDIVVLLGGGEAVQAILLKVEGLGISDGGIPDGGIRDGGISDGGIRDGGIDDAGVSGWSRPRWVLGDRALSEELLGIGSRDELRKRVTGVVRGPIGWSFESFRLKYRLKYPDGADVFGAAGAYDAAYLIALSAVLREEKPVTGTDLSNGLRMLNGTRQSLNIFDAGVEAIIDQLRQHGDVDFDGASGPLDFDAKGDPPFDFLVWCLPRDAKTHQTLMGKFSGLYFDARTNVFNTAQPDPTICNSGD
jgi:branched-chain amino acid transport system substrate-binding protein